VFVAEQKHVSSREGWVFMMQIRSLSIIFTFVFGVGLTFWGLFQMTGEVSSSLIFKPLR